MKTILLRSGACLLAVAAAIALVPRASFAQQKLGAPPGKGSFVRYCASCHGVDGKGNGPFVPMLKEKPGDLTQLAKKNGGKFPALEVADAIDGRKNIPGHGTADMPIWGERFGETESGAGSPTTQTAIRQRIQLIIRYIDHIQEK